MIDIKMIETKNLIWNKKTRTLVCEASDLYDCGWSPIDSWIDVKSSHTNVVKCFTKVTTKFNNEGELLYWEYYNAETGIIFKIYND